MIVNVFAQILRQGGTWWLAPTAHLRHLSNFSFQVSSSPRIAKLWKKCARVINKHDKKVKIKCLKCLNLNHANNHNHCCTEFLLIVNSDLCIVNDKVGIVCGTTTKCGVYFEMWSKQKAGGNVPHAALQYNWCGVRSCAECCVWGVCSIHFCICLFVHIIFVKS